MATIGRRSAVMELPHRMRIRGTIAWVAWLALHLVTLIGNRNRLSALVNLAYPRRDEAPSAACAAARHQGPGSRSAE